MSKGGVPAILRIIFLPCGGVGHRPGFRQGGVRILGAVPLVAVAMTLHGHS